MIKAKVNNKYDFVAEDAFLTTNGKSKLEITQVRKGSFHITKDSRTFRAEVLKANTEEKNFVLRINGNKYTVQLKDKHDELLEKLGMSNAASAKIKDIKAPMPGLVVDVRVKEGEEIKKGDALVVLQAMKMENILKCPADVTIKKVHVKKDDILEKNQLIISFN